MPQPTAKPASFAVDLAAGRYAPLVWRREAAPDGLAPQIVDGPDGPVLRLGVETGAYPDATAGEPETCQRGEVREPGTLECATRSLHGFDLRLRRDFPRSDLRCVVAQLKGADGLSPIWALRARRGRLYVDWRAGGLTVEHHLPLVSWPGVWVGIALEVGPEGAALQVDGLPVTTYRGPMPARRYLKLGPYRDRDAGWGSGPAVVEVRRISRIIL